MMSVGWLDGGDGVVMMNGDSDCGGVGGVLVVSLGVVDGVGDKVEAEMI